MKYQIRYPKKGKVKKTDSISNGELFIVGSYKKENYNYKKANKHQVGTEIDDLLASGLIVRRKVRVK